MFPYLYGTPTVLNNVGYGASGASLASSTVAGFNSWSSTAMIDLMSRMLLVIRSRQLAIMNPIAAATIQRFTSGIVGSGIRYGAPKESEFIGDIYPLLGEAIQKRFSIASRTHELDAQEQLTFSQMQSLAVRSMMLNGDVAYVRQPDSHSWRIIESDRIVSPYYMVGTEYRCEDGCFRLVNQETGNVIVQGVELSPVGKPVALWILKEYLQKPWTVAEGQIERIPMDDPETGLPLCLLLYESLRADQYRGAPVLSPVIEQIICVQNYTQAELAAAQLQSSVWSWIETPMPTRDDTSPELPSRLDELVPVLDDSEEADEGENEGEDKPEQTPNFTLSTKSKEELLAEMAMNAAYPRGKVMGAGECWHLKDGESLKYLQSTHPSQQFAQFTEANIEQIASGVGLPSQVLRMTYDGSYSASRAAILEAGKRFDELRSHFIERFLKPVIEVFVYDMVKDMMPQDEALYIANAMALEAIWQAPHDIVIDTRAEIEGLKTAIELGLVSRDEAAMTLFGHKAVAEPTVTE